MKTLAFLLLSIPVLCAQTPGSNIMGNVSLPILAPGTNGQRVIVLKQDVTSAPNFINTLSTSTFTKWANIDAQGNYIITGVPDGTYTLIPIVDGANVKPYNPQIVVAGADQVVNFVATEAPGSLSVFASTGDLTYCVASKVSTTKPQLKVQCRRAGVTKCDLDLITDTIDFHCGDLMWNIWTIPNGFHYQVWSWDRAPDTTITGSHLASFGTISWPPTAQKKQKTDKALKKDQTHQVGYVLIQINCTRCHNANKPPNGLDLTSVAAMLQGGKQGPAILPGHADQSLLYRAIQPDLNKVPPSGRMPPVPNGMLPPLTPQQIKSIKEWIDSL